MAVPVYPPIDLIRIDLYWEDKVVKGTKSFRNVQEFAEFLKDNPTLAEAIGYVAKPKK